MAVRWPFLSPHALKAISLYLSAYALPRAFDADIYFSAAARKKMMPQSDASLRLFYAARDFMPLGARIY